MSDARPPLPASADDPCRPRPREGQAPARSLPAGKRETGPCRPARWGWSVVALCLGLLLSGCSFYRTDLEPGLEIDEHGRIVPADVRAYKRRCQAEVSAAVGQALGEGWQAEILIAEEPFPATGDGSCYWRSITAVCRLSGPAGEALPMDRFKLIALLRRRLQPYMRGDQYPYIELAGDGVGEDFPTR